MEDILALRADCVHYAPLHPDLEELCRFLRSGPNDFSDVERSYVDVDTTCVHLVQDPSRFDVIVTDNLFGDILSDLVAALSGTIDRAGSADLNPDRTGPSLFEPIHGTTAYLARSPEQANPLGAYAAAAMMLDHLGARETAQSIRVATATISPEQRYDLDETEAAVREACASRRELRGQG